MWLLQKQFGLKIYIKVAFLPIDDPDTEICRTDVPRMVENQLIIFPFWVYIHNMFCLLYSAIYPILN